MTLKATLIVPTIPITPVTASISFPRFPAESMASAGSGGLPVKSNVEGKLMNDSSDRLVIGLTFQWNFFGSIFSYVSSCLSVKLTIILIYGLFVLTILHFSW
jgi:hypothetical protein